MYSFGLILWEIAAREYPYRGANNSFPLIKIWKEQGQEEPIPEDTPAYFAEAIKHCRALNPKSRPDAAEMIRFLEGSKDKAGEVILPSANYESNFSSVAAVRGMVGSALQSMFGWSTDATEAQKPAAEAQNDEASAFDDVSFGSSRPG